MGSGGQSYETYTQWFNPQVKNNYEIAKLVMAGSRENEKIFVWGDQPMIYALARRLPATKYTVAYHVKEFGAEKETIEKLQQTPPRYVVLWGNGEDLPGLTELLRQDYIREQKEEKPKYIVYGKSEEKIGAVELAGGGCRNSGGVGTDGYILEELATRSAAVI